MIEVTAEHPAVYRYGRALICFLSDSHVTRCSNGVAEFRVKRAVIYGDVSRTRNYCSASAQVGIKAPTAISGSSMGIPSSIGSTKHTKISDFYTLADALNTGLETPVWENVNGGLPTLKSKKEVE